MAVPVPTRTTQLDTLITGTVEDYFASGKLLDQISVASTFLIHWAGRDLEFTGGKIPPPDLFSLTQVKRSAPEDGIQFASPAGELIRVPLRAARNNTVKAIGSYGSVDDTTQNPNREALFRWRSIIGSVSYSTIDKSRFQGANAIAPYVQTLIDDLKESVTNYIATTAFGDGTGDGGKQPLGLQAIVHITPSSAGNLGGINRNTAGNAFYRNQSQNHGSKPLNVANVQSTILSATRGVYRPTFAITTKTVWLEWWKQLLPQERNIKLSGLSNLGVDHIVINGSLPLLYSEFCPSGYMYLLSKRAVKLYVNKNMAGSLTDWVSDKRSPQVKVAAWMLDYQMVPWFPKELGVVYGIGSSS